MARKVKKSVDPRRQRPRIGAMFRRSSAFRQSQDVEQQLMSGLFAANATWKRRWGLMEYSAPRNCGSALSHHRKRASG